VKSALDDADISLSNIIQGAFPLVLIMIAVVIILVLVPEISLIFVRALSSNNVTSPALGNYTECQVYFV